MACEVFLCLVLLNVLLGSTGKSQTQDAELERIRKMFIVHCQGEEKVDGGLWLARQGRVGMSAVFWAWLGDWSAGRKTGTHATILWHIETGISSASKTTRESELRRHNVWVAWEHEPTTLAETTIRPWVDEEVGLIRPLSWWGDGVQVRWLISKQGAGMSERKPRPQQQRRRTRETRNEGNTRNKLQAEPWLWHQK